MLNDAIIGCGTSGLVTHWSQGAEAMFGYKAMEAVGCPITMLGRPGQADLLRAVLLDIGRGSPVHRTELVLNRRGGARLVVMISATPVHDRTGNPIGASMVLRDVTQERRLADELADARSRLAIMQNQTVQLSRLAATERIALHVAHELNQPLAAVVNYVLAGQRLLADPTEPHLEQLGLALEGAMAQSLHAGRIVGGIRAFVMRGETDKRVEPVAALVREAVALAMPDTEAHRVRLSLALDPAAALVLVDRVQIEQVLVNLIRNAVEAMRDCPRRDLSIASHWTDGTVEISVADSGKGVPAEVRDRLFEPFVTTRRDGTGLGLTICQAIVEAHGGALSYLSAPDGGSVFRFTVTGVAETPS